MVLQVYSFIKFSIVMDKTWPITQIDNCTWNLPKTWILWKGAFGADIENETSSKAELYELQRDVSNWSPKVC